MELSIFVRRGFQAVQDPKYSKYLVPLLLIADIFLSALVVLKVPYTEIDWKAYMEQISQYLSGELNYVKIRGETGPLVYPAGHVYIYSLLYKITDHGRDIVAAQFVFLGLYIATLAVVLSVYLRAKIPPYILPLLILSKRLHSIYLLRLFNDCFSVFFLFLSIAAYQRRQWTFGSALYSLSVSIKMGSLLALPGIGIVLLQAIGRGRALRQASIMAQLQFLLGWPFITHNALSYLTRAFELSRKFLWRETVNWRWLENFGGEEVFHSPWFSRGLLLLHLSLLLTFLATRWIKPARGLSLYQFLKIYLLTWTPPQPDSLQGFQLSQHTTPAFIATTILTSNLIGVLCARSLHFQFYSWIAWGTPYLLYKTGWNPVVIYAVWLAQEYGWNVWPSSTRSSVIVVTALAIVVAGVWWGTREGEDVILDVDEDETRKGRSEKKNI